MSAKRIWASALIGALAVSFIGPAGARAQAQDIGTIQSEILTLDPDRLFAGTQVGKRLTRQYEAERDRLIANNRELEADLRAEEQALTDARKTMTPKEFREKADAFDNKVRSIRQENERAARDLERGREIAPLTLMRMAEPILVELMRDTNGKIILDNRQVLLRSDTVDITDLAIERVDAAIGDGSGEEDAPTAPAEQQDAPGAGDAPDDAPADPAD
ncbi:OmpH family outer membrane protein [Pelagivirga sediminicola]|nr:OmpH family outer membrane protein [Pelagivirga sediminicola]